MDKNRFSQFEERIRALVEGGFARLFAGRLQPREVALRLARAMEDNAELDHEGHLAAPNRYIVRLHPADHAALLAAQHNLSGAMAQHLIDLARESDLRLDAPPEVVLIPDGAIPLHGLAVLAEYVTTLRQATQMMAPVTPDEGESPDAGPDLPIAFLVVNGERYVPLDRMMINVGRRRDNTIVLDDPRVSRQHCQVRYRVGQFVLYDLGSRGGTFVNNQRISECVLRSGDVISLAGVTVVFVIEEGSTGGHAPGSGDTQQVQPRHSDPTLYHAPDSDPTPGEDGTP